MHIIFSIAITTHIMLDSMYFSKTDENITTLPLRQCQCVSNHRWLTDEVHKTIIVQPIPWLSAVLTSLYGLGYQGLLRAHQGRSMHPRLVK